jgi:hypothetical protein
VAAIRNSRSDGDGDPRVVVEVIDERESIIGIAYIYM